MVNHIIFENSGDIGNLKERTNGILIFAKDSKDTKIDIFSSEEYAKISERHLSHLSNIKINTSKKPIEEAMIMHKRSKNSVFVSAGDTGKIVKHSLVLERVFRDTQPILMNTYPKINEHFVIADIGATLKPNMIWVALACRAIAEAIYGKAKVGMLNIGEEEHKGTKEIQQINDRLSVIMKDDFIGNKEINIAVKDNKTNALCMPGYIGNIVIKAYEAAFALLKGKVMVSEWSFIGGPLFKILKKTFLSELDWRVYSGAYLIGTHGKILITHGRSDKIAIYNACLRAIDPVIEKIYRSIQYDTLLNENFDRK